MQCDEASKNINDQTQESGWSWLKNPWVLLILGVAAMPLLWVGIGLCIEFRRATALAELQATPGIMVQVFGDRYPIWIPHWLGKKLGDEWAPRVDDLLVVSIEQHLTDQQLELLNRQMSINAILFYDGGEVSDAGLLKLCETHRFTTLHFYPARPLNTRQYAALVCNANLRELKGIKGPFDQAATDALAQMPQLKNLDLTGPLSAGTRSPDFSRFKTLNYLRWRDSQLTDEQFSNLASWSSFSTLSLYDTQLTASSWKLLPSTVNLLHLTLESPHIDDRLADELAPNTVLQEVQLRGGEFSDQALRKLLGRGIRGVVEAPTRNLSLQTAMLIGKSQSLTHLTLRGGPQVNDDILAALVHDRLDELKLLRSSITDSGIERLKTCSNLRRLGLPNSQLTDRGLIWLGTLPSLSQLDLRNTAITDDGLGRFSFARDGFLTQRLHLGGTRVTAAAVKQFKVRAPSVVVHGVDGIETDGEEELHFPPLDDDTPASTDEQTK